MARQNGQLADWGDEIPEEVLELAEAYDAAHTAKSKAAAEVNTARDNLTAKMGELGVPRVPIRNGAKFLTIKVSENVRYEKPKNRVRDDNDDLPTDPPSAPQPKASKKKSAPKKKAKAASEPGPADPPASDAPKRFNTETPFAGLEVPNEWLTKFTAAGFNDCWDLMAAAEKKNGLKSLKFAATAIEAIRNALERWTKTGFYLDGTTAAYDAGAAAARGGQAIADNPHGELDPRHTHWSSGWEETDPADVETEDDE